MNAHEDRQRAAQEIARAGREFYERDIRAQVEPDFDGKFLVVDITTGDYAVADTDEEAFSEAEAKNPDGRFHLLKVGRSAAHRIGATSRRSV